VNKSVDCSGVSVHDCLVSCHQMLGRTDSAVTLRRLRSPAGRPPPDLSTSKKVLLTICCFFFFFIDWFREYDRLIVKTEPNPWPRNEMDLLPFHRDVTFLFPVPSGLPSRRSVAKRNESIHRRSHLMHTYVRAGLRCTKKKKKNQRGNLLFVNLADPR
jgi:hypothetical protein